ncbi:MAG: agmatinase family protein [Acidobacteriota bacterium]
MIEFDPNAAALSNSGIYGLPHTLAESLVVIIPVPFEATTSYGGGAAAGPAAILAASRQVDLYDYGTGRPYEAGIYLLAESPQIQDYNRKAKRLAKPIIARGGDLTGAASLQRNLKKVNEYGAAVNELVYQQAKDLIAQGKIVGVIGGDHAAPYGTIAAHAEAFPGLGILHLDAHCDLREAFEGFTWSHASIMYNVMTRLDKVARLVQVGIRDFSEQELQMVHAYGGRIVTHFDEALGERKFAGEPWAHLVEEIIKDLPTQVYLSFDIDGLDPTLCPSTGTPVPGGLSFPEVVALLAALVRSGRHIVGFDLNEVAPSPQGGEWDANVGARLLYKMIGYTLLSRKNRC